MMATPSLMSWDCGVMTPARPASRWMWMRSATSHTCGMLWLMRMIGRPLVAQLLDHVEDRVADSLTPRAAVGSSRMTTLLPNAAARATATAWRWPPDRVSTA